MALVLAPATNSAVDEWRDTRPSSGVSGTAELYERLMSQEKDEKNNQHVMPLQIGDYVPDFIGQSTNGEIDFHAAIDGSWSLVYICPRSFEAVASSDLASLAKMSEEFTTKKVRRCAVCCDTIHSIEKWKKDIQELFDCQIDFPLVSDLDGHIARDYGLVRYGEDTRKSLAVRALIPASLLVLADPDRRIQLILQYSQTTGHNFEELFRSIEALQLSYQHPLLSTRANWMTGDDVFISSDISADEARAHFPRGFVQIRPWFTLTAAPNENDQQTHGDDDSNAVAGSRFHETDAADSSLASQTGNNLLVPSTLDLALS